MDTMGNRRYATVSTLDCYMFRNTNYSTYICGFDQCRQRRDQKIRRGIQKIHAKSTKSKFYPWYHTSVKKQKISGDNKTLFVQKIK